MKRNISDFLEALYGSFDFYRMMFFIWLVLGVLVLCGERITRTTYFCTWAVLMVEYLDRVVNGKQE